MGEWNDEQDVTHRIYYEYFRSNLVVMGMFLFGGVVNHKTGDKEGFAQCHFALFYDSGYAIIFLGMKKIKF